MLLTRRNEGLESILKDFVEELKKRNEREAAEKKKKDKGKGKATAIAGE